MQTGIKKEDQSDLESIIHGSGFVSALCHSLAGIASSDGPITLDEYGLIVEISKKLSVDSDNPTLINVFVLQGILNKIPFSHSLKIIAQNQMQHSDESKKSIFNAILPLINRQYDAEGISRQLSAALHICSDVNKVTLHLKNKLPAYLSFVKKQLGDIFPTSHGTSGIESFAERYKDDILNDYLKKYKAEKTPANLEQLNKHLEQSKREVLESLQTFKKQISLHCQQNSTADQLTILAETLYAQVKQRLVEIEKRATLQKELFKDDIDEFIAQSVNELELSLRQKLEVKDWTNKKVWDDIAQSEPAKALSEQYDKLNVRYEKIFKLWNDEFSHFSKELTLTQKIILQGLEKEDLSQLIQPPSPRLKILQKLDQTSSLIINTIKMAGAGSATIGGVAIATGVPASIFLVSATTIGSFIISSPLGWAAVGTVTLAGIYQYLSNPQKRRGKEIQNIRTVIEDALKKMIGYPEESHNQHMDYIVDNFRRTAEKNFSPLIQDTRLSVKMNEMQLEVITMIESSMLEELEQLEPAT
ncbi:MAG: hypothetical protein GY694_19600 [Gammaproteobacteria bacterium]|nr:hypothetical protein [Gammaproteobacteria bacterium]